MSLSVIYYLLTILVFVNIFFLKSFIFILLLWLEVILLLFILGISLFFALRRPNLGILIIYTLTIAVCEATLALRVLVRLSRSNSRMTIHSLSILKC